MLYKDTVNSSVDSGKELVDVLNNDDINSSIDVGKEFVNVVNFDDVNGSMEVPVGKKFVDVLNNDDVNSSVDVDEQLVNESDDSDDVNSSSDVNEQLVNEREANDDVNSSVGVEEHVNGFDGAEEEQLAVTDIDINDNLLYYRQRGSSVNVEGAKNVLLPNSLDDEVTRDNFVIGRTFVVKPIHKIKPG